MRISDDIPAPARETPMNGGPRGWQYDGPPEERLLAESALRWVVDPVSGADVIARGLVRTVVVDEGAVQVRLAPLPDAGVTAMLVEDLQAELFDHFHGDRRVVVTVASDPPRRWHARPHLRRVA